MGRGGYHGGSTIITSWGGGWSSDARSIAQGKKKQNPKKAPTFEKQFKTYAHACGIWSNKEKPWQLAPKLVFAHFEGDLEAVKSAVEKSPEFKHGLQGKKKKASNRFEQAGAKKIIREDRKAKNLLNVYVRACAKADFKQKERPSIPLFITEKFSADDVKEWLSQVHQTDLYKAEVRKLKGLTASWSSKKSKKWKVSASG